MILMAFSVALLAMFEIFWLRSEYHDQKEWLNKEQSHFFYSAIRSLEDSLFNEMVLRPLQVSVDSFEFSGPSGLLRFQKQKDSSKQVTMIRSRSIDIQERRRDYSTPPKSGPRPHRSILLGALSMHLSEDQDSAVVAARMESMIQEQLLYEESIRANGVPLAYNLIHWDDGQTYDEAGMVSAPYIDYWSRQSFAITYPEYVGFLLNKMWRQFAFAFVLFSLTAVAFAMVYRALVRQRRLAAMRTDFINNITHELKTPISTVRVALEAVTNFEPSDPKRNREYLDIAQSELDRLTLLVDKVLQMSQMNEGNTELKVETFDMRDLITQIVSTMKVQFDRLSAEVELDSQGEEFDIEADRMHLTGVVYNLLDNAMKYRSEKPEIDVMLRQDNGSIVLSVHDNGKGIAPEYVDKIFDRFFRVPTGDRHNTKGHGLGLSYVAEVVRQHHGTIAVDSAPGSGSTFTLTLPRQHAN